MYVEARRKLVEWLRSQLIGPAGEGSSRMSPLERYPTGVLHPVEPGARSWSFSTGNSACMPSVTEPPPTGT